MPAAPWIAGGALPEGPLQNEPGPRFLAADPRDPWRLARRTCLESEPVALGQKLILIQAAGDRWKQRSGPRPAYVGDLKSGNRLSSAAFKNLKWAIVVASS